MFKKFFIISYAIYIIAIIDSLLYKPVFNNSNIVSFLFLLFLVIGVILENVTKKKENRLKINKNEFDQFLFCLLINSLYLLELLNDNVNFGECKSQICFILITFFTFHFCRELNVFNQIILVSFGICSFFLVWQFILNGAHIYQFTGVRNIFFPSEYYRIKENIGFYHANGCANLAYITLILSCFLVHFNLSNKGSLIYISNILIFFIDLLIVNIILLNNSRNCLAALMVFFLVDIYYIFSNNNRLNKNIKFGIRIIIGLCFVCILMYSLGLFSKLFTISNRVRNFKQNLPLLNSVWKQLFGLGIINPGDYGAKTIFSSSYYVDNYYLYIIMDFGIIGTAIIVGILLKLGIKLHNNIFKKHNNWLARLSFALFIAQLFNGLGETCVIYYFFPSSFFYLLVSFICY